MTQARSMMRLVLRSRTVRLVAGFCVVCALAFTLGQSVAAFRASLAQQAATPLAPQTLERLAGAQGTTPTPPPAQPSHQAATPDGFSSGPHHAAPVGHFEAQPGKDATKGKDKTHPNHGHDGKAAGDSSHGGLSHDNGNGPGSDNGNGSDSGGHGADNGSGHGAGHQSGQNVGSHTGHGD